MRRELHAIDPNVPVTEIETLTASLDRFFAPVRATGTVLAAAAGIALFLSTIGLYGILSPAAAQQEARYAILALSSAAGRSSFDAALRRYIDFLTADGALEVELTIDPSIALGPDEQIELFRIVQEGLGNARRHAGATRAVVEIGWRHGERVVSIRDNGKGFDAEPDAAGQGLRNMRLRASSIGGRLSIASAPGRGTALEVVLRA